MVKCNWRRGYQGEKGSVVGAEKKGGGGTLRISGQILAPIKNGKVVGEIGVSALMKGVESIVLL